MEYIAEDLNIRAWHYQVCANFFFITLLVTVLTAGGISMALPHPPTAQLT
jgi:hypothetical protein